MPLLLPHSSIYCHLPSGLLQVMAYKTVLSPSLYFPTAITVIDHQYNKIILPPAKKNNWGFVIELFPLDKTAQEAPNPYDS